MVTGRGAGATQPTPGRFVGRRRELRELAAALECSRLVTLTGPAGVGKTRLVRELVPRVRDRYPDGVHVVELAPLRDPDLIPQAFASALAIREQPGHGLVDTIAARLKSSGALLIVDNCEHLVQGCAEFLGRMLASAPHLRILTTSQIRLAVSGEQVWPLPPLELPAPPAGRDALAGSDAVSLFCARAAEVSPGFAADEETLEAVAEICRRLDGIPLAIELAAARAPALTPRELVTRLDERFTLLGDIDQSVPSRHQTLRTAIGWSYDLLSPPEQRLLRRMSVFVGGCCLDAAEEVCGWGMARHEVLAVLAGLVSRSMVVANTSGVEARYSPLETIRIYAAERLAEAGEEIETRAWHLEWCVTLAERAEPAVTGTEQPAWLDRLDRDHSNLRAALGWAGAGGRVGAMVQLAGALTIFWRIRGHFREGREWLESGLARGDDQNQALRARALWGAGFLALMLNEDGLSLRRLEAARELAVRIGDRRLEARVLLLLGNRIMFTDPPEGQALLDSAVALAREVEDAWCLAHALALRGRVHMDLGAVGQAHRDLDEGILLARRTHDQQSLKIGLLVAGHLALDGGSLARAEPLLAEGLDVAEQLGEPYSVAAYLSLLGEAAYLRGHHTDAGRRLDAALPMARDAGNPLLVIAVLCGGARLALDQDDLDSARVQFTEALSVAAQIDGRSFTAVLGLADVAIAAGDLPEARRRLAELASMVSGGSDRGASASVCTRMAELARAEGQRQEALSLYRRAVSLWQDVALGAEFATSLEAIAILLGESGSLDQAARLFGAAQVFRDQTGYARTHRRVRDHEAAVAAVRLGLGAEQFDLAWREGFRLTAADAVAYATRGSGGRVRGDAGWDSLTPTELEIATLVAEGLTNREIGERLFNSARTVERHITHALAKLDMRSRRELGREAMRRGTAAAGRSAVESTPASRP